MLNIEGEIRPKPHKLTIDDRTRVTVTGVMEVESFDEGEIVVVTSGGLLVIAAESLHLVKLNLDDGHLVAEGLIIGTDYEELDERKSGFFSKVFR